MEKTHLMQDALNVGPPNKKSLPTDADKRWYPSVRIPRHHLVGREQQRVFKRLYEGSKQLLGCPWCQRDGSVAVPSHMVDLCDNAKETKPSIIQCCRMHMAAYKAIHEHGLQVATRPFCDHRFDASFPARRAVRMPYQPDELVQTIQQDVDKNLRTQAPLSTVLIRWHVKKQDPGYWIDTVRSELVKFGDVTDIVRTGELSVRATFLHLASACDAVSRKYIGRDSNPMMILWYHRTMKNKTFHLWNRHLHVHVDPFT